MADLGDVARSTRRAATRCIRCGALGHSTVVNIPVGCAEPVDVTCPWTDQRMCPEGQAALPPAECGSCLDAMPYVCPGCHAVGGERCAPGCIDDEMRREHEHAIETGDYERFDDEETSQ